MKSGEDFRQAMGQADDGFVRVIAQALSDLRVMRKPRREGRRALPHTARHKRHAAVSQKA